MRNAILTTTALLLPLPCLAQLSGEEKKAESGLAYVLKKGKKPQGAPLMILLHGSGGDLNVFAEQGDGWAGAAEQNGFVLAVPGGQKAGHADWDSGDEQKILDLASELVRTLGCDPKRVYLGGFSSGAFRAIEWGLKRPDVFAAVLSICGGGRGEPDFPEEAREMGVYVIAATNDQYVKFAETKAYMDKLKTKGFKNIIFKEKNQDHIRYHEEAKAFYRWALNFARKFVPGKNNTVSWAENADEALKKAAEDKKKVMIYFYSAKDDKNAAIESFETELFKDKEVLEALGELVCIKVDRDQNKDLAKQYKVTKSMIVFINAEKGRQIESQADRVTPKQFVEKIKKALKK